MTPKQKSEELVYYFENRVCSLIDRNIAKQCALFTVSEIIKTLGEIYNDAIPIPEDYNGEMIMRDYFEKVQNEIEIM